MQETSTAITAGKEASQEGLNTVFGIPDSLRKLICAGLIVGSAFISGCAKSLEERSVTIDNLSSPPVTLLVENPKWFDGTEIAVRGTPKFVSDMSFSEIQHSPVYAGKSIAAIPIPVEHKLIVYQLHAEDGSATGIYLNSKQELPENDLKISGTVLHQHGKAVLEVLDFVPATQATVTK